MTKNTSKDRVSPLPGDIFDIIISGDEIPFEDGVPYYYGHWVVIQVHKNGYCRCLPMDIAPVIMVNADLEIDDPFPPLHKEEIPKTIRDLLPGIGRQSEPTPHVIRWTGRVWVYGKILENMPHLGRLDPSIVAELIDMENGCLIPFFIDEVSDSDGLGLDATLSYCPFDCWEKEHIASLGNELGRIEAYQRVHAPRVRAIIVPSQRKLILEALAYGELEISDELLEDLCWDMDIN